MTKQLPAREAALEALQESLRGEAEAARATLEAARLRLAPLEEAVHAAESTVKVRPLPDPLLTPS
eukprot:1196083-Prorocentrum_minimum.AAC.9